MSFHTLYGYLTRLHIPYVLCDSPVPEASLLLRDCEESIRLLKFHIDRARNHVKQQAEEKHLDLNFDVGDTVYLKLHLYKRAYLKPNHNHKLLPKYFGPF